MALVRAALALFRQHTDRVTIKTQITNYSALGLYQRAGFVVERAQVTLHCTL
jgi:ribosomal protein S18 acetylase RimI-like enzyme